MTPESKPTGPVGVATLGHRRYVGGMWDRIGRHQFDYLVAAGVTPDDYILDVACGSLRAGVHLIPWAKPGHYAGIDIEPTLIEAGRGELGPDIIASHRPTLVVGSCTDIDSYASAVAGLGSFPTVTLAHSLFTHLTPDHIGATLRCMRAGTDDPARIFATFFEGDESDNPPRSHAHDVFRYRVDTVRGMAAAAGLAVEWVGDWGHPRGQSMAIFRRAERGLPGSVWP